MREIDGIYQSMCSNLLRKGDHVNGTYEINNFKVTLNDIDENIISIRDLSPCYLLGEWLWYFMGRNDVDFISAFGSMWRRLSDDGKTNNSAYGYIMQYKFGFNQIDKIIELLRKDPSSRRAVININTPNKRVIETKDEPCTIALQFLIRNGRLNLTAMMRSNDIYLGFPYDVAFFTELQKYIADQLGIGYGTYTHFATSLHVYDRDVDKINSIAYHPESKIIKVNRKNFHDLLPMAAALVSANLASGTKEDFMNIFKQLGILEE